MFRLAALLIVFGLAACGAKGPLELPPDSHSPPLLENGDPATADANTPARSPAP
ncbi:MAG: lipoprotein [Azonexus sp.]|nr:lipoprotein [Azonexus sp.]